MISFKGINVDFKLGRSIQLEDFMIFGPYYSVTGSTVAQKRREKCTKYYKSELYFYTQKNNDVP